MAEPTEVCGSAELGSCRLAVVRPGRRANCVVKRTSCISNLRDRTSGQLAEIIRRTASSARGSTGWSARHREELT